MIAGAIDFGPGFIAVLAAVGLLALVVCFLIGSISPATLLASLFGKDVRGSGSGNPGATNAGRILGVKWGVLVGVLDVLKGFVPCWFLAGFMGVTASAVCGLAVVLGHMFSPLLKWRGGKGVATTLGVLLAVAPWIALIALVVFGLGLAILKRVGEASVVTCLVLVVVGVLQGLGVVHLARWGATGVGWVVVILALLVLARHKRNILIGLERRRRAIHRP